MKFEKYTLKSGKVRWKFFHYLGMNPDTGKKDVIERQGFNSKAEARDALLEIIKDYEKGQKITNLEKGRLRFGEVVDLWLIQYQKQVTPTTFTNRQALFKNHILPIFKDYYIEKVDVRMCQEAVNTWYSSFAEASRLVNFTSNIFKFGINQGFCNDNPMAKTIRPKNTFKEDYDAPFYEKEDLMIFLQVLKTDESLRAYTMFHTLAYTGLRRGELFGLQWRDIDFKKKTLTVDRTVVFNSEIKKYQFAEPKTKSSRRTISIDDVTIQKLLEWRNHQLQFFLGRGINAHSHTQLVFSSQTNHFITDSYLRRIIKRVTEKHNLPHITVHGFRHTHCSLLFEAGVEMHNVKERLGHSNIQTTMNIYTHVTKSERDKTADIFNDFMLNING